MSAVFDHLQPGTSESLWSESRLAALPRDEPPGPCDRLLVIAAHPDDESLGCGGLIAAAAARGAAVEVIVATDGEGSHPRSPTHSRARLAEIRRNEAVSAVRALAPRATTSFLALPDGDLQARTAELVDEIARRLPGSTYVVSPWSGDGHPDHEACAQAVRVALGTDDHVVHWQYPIWAWHWARPASDDLPWDRLRRLDLNDEQRRFKRTALCTYRSQLSPLSSAEGDEAVVSPESLAYFGRDYEVFVGPTTHPAEHASYFDALYRSHPDPWGLAQRFYERRKRAVLLASLPRERFARCFEPGCAIGLLTAELAQRCDQLVAWDVAESAVKQTRARLGDTAAVLVKQGRIPREWPDGDFDLVVLSEVGYYCADVAELARRARDSLTDGGFVAACHWRHAAADHPRTAEEVHDALTATGLIPIVRHAEDDFLLDIWSRTGESVARAEGILG